MNFKLIVPTALILATGMGIGSLHNAQARGSLPGFFTPFGFTLIALTFVAFICGILIFKYFDRADTITKRTAMGAAILATIIESLNLVTTLASEGSLSGWLFHEYLGIIAAPIAIIAVAIVPASNR